MLSQIFSASIRPQLLLQGDPAHAMNPLLKGIVLVYVFVDGFVWCAPGSRSPCSVARLARLCSGTSSDRSLCSNMSVACAPAPSPCYPLLLWGLGPLVRSSLLEQTEHPNCRWTLPLPTLTPVTAHSIINTALGTTGLSVLHSSTSVWQVSPCPHTRQQQ